MQFDSEKSDTSKNSSTSNLKEFVGVLEEEQKNQEDVWMLSNELKKRIQSCNGPVYML